MQQRKPTHISHNRWLCYAGALKARGGFRLAEPMPAAPLQFVNPTCWINPDHLFFSIGWFWLIWLICPTLTYFCLPRFGFIRFDLLRLGYLSFAFLFRLSKLGLFACKMNNTSIAKLPFSYFLFFLLGLGWPGLTWLGLAWLRLAWLGLAGLDLACFCFCLTCIGCAWLGLCWRGSRGLAWHGSASLCFILLCLV